MFLGAFSLFLIYACIRGLSRDVNVLGFVVLIGFMQDPARKMIAGEPVVMTVMVGLAFACIVVRQAFFSRASLAEPFTKWNPAIKPALISYLLIVGLQAVHSLLRYGSPIIPALGSIFYLAPLTAICIGYFQFIHFDSIRRFLLVFCGLAIVVAFSVIFSFLGMESQLLGEVGSGLIIYDQGTILKAYSGLMRSSEVASWHMGACVCFIIILAGDKRSMPIFLLSTLAVILLMSSIILTGRRKMIVQVLIFCVLYFPILRFYQGRLSNRFLLFSISALLFVVMVYWFLPDFEGTQYDLYVARSVSVFSDAGGRFSKYGIGTIAWAYDVYGFFGGGLGVAAQGAQHFATGNITSTGAGEGGIGKLVLELGLMSLLIIAWLGFTIAAHIHRCLQLVAAATPNKLVFMVGALVFVVANIPTFMIASQVFGDMFVLLMLGLLSGSLFAIPRQVSGLLADAK